MREREREERRREKGSFSRIVSAEESEIAAKSDGRKMAPDLFLAHSSRARTSGAREEPNLQTMFLRRERNRFSSCWNAESLLSPSPRRAVRLFFSLPLLRFPLAFPRRFRGGAAPGGTSSSSSSPSPPPCSRDHLVTLRGALDNDGKKNRAQIEWIIRRMEFSDSSVVVYDVYKRTKAPSSTSP